MSAAQREFGRRLRDQRERAGITLAAIAESTKIKASLLDDLERGDLSKWPGGIFRRAFARTYAIAIGLPPEPLIEEFGQLFPEGDESDRFAESESDLRLTLAVDPWRLVIASAVRAIVAIVEAGAVVVVAWLAAWLSATSPSVACAVAALAYYVTSAASMGRSPAMWYLQSGGRVAWQRRSEMPSPSPASRELIHLVHRRPQVGEPMTEEAAGTSARSLRAASR